MKFDNHTSRIYELQNYVRQRKWLVFLRLGIFWKNIFLASISDTSCNQKQHSKTETALKKISLSVSKATLLIVNNKKNCFIFSKIQPIH